MRSLVAMLIVSFAMCSGVSAQSNSNKNQPSPKKAEQPAKAESTPDAKQPSQEPPASQEQKPAGDKDKEKDEHHDMTEKPPIVTHHQITLGGKALKYTATTGRLPIKRGDGKIEAEMFFVAYTLDGEEGKRPLTFAFNGGPGSASIWLHMGALGPQRVVLNPDGFLPPAPYRIEDNPYTLLDKSDLVLVDAIGTGFSRAETAEILTKKFWGVKGDIDAFSEFIRLYITRYERWSFAAVFVAAKVTGHALCGYRRDISADWAFRFNGITLLSTVLNFQTLTDHQDQR